MSNGFVKSAARTMQIYECFEDLKRPLTISELVKHLGIPQSSMSALMKSLLSQGFVDYDARSRAYTPSVRIALMGNWMMESPRGSDHLLGLLQELHTETGDTVLLGVLNGVETQYIHVVNSYQRLRFHLRPGMMRPMFQTAIGLVLASLRDDREIGRMIRRVNTEISDHRELLQEAEVMSNIRQVRDNGFIVTSNLATPGAGVAATLLKNSPSARPMAIGIGAPIPRLNESGDFIVETLMSSVDRYAQSETQRAA